MLVVIHFHVEICAHLGLEESIGFGFGESARRGAGFAGMADSAKLGGACVVFWFFFFCSRPGA